MRRDCRRLAYFALAGALVLAATGCPDSETINNGSFELSYVTDAVKDEDYACVLMNIERITIRPNDGICDNTGDPCFNNTDCNPNGECEGARAKDAIPGDELESVGGAFQGLQGANFTDQGEPCAPLGDLAVSGEDFPFQDYDEGLYRMTELFVTNPQLVKANGDAVDCVTSADLTGSQYVDLYGDSLLFRLGKDQPNTVRFVIDAAVLADILDGPDCGGDIFNNRRFFDFLEIQTTQ